MSLLHSPLLLLLFLLASALAHHADAVAQTPFNSSTEIFVAFPSSVLLVRASPRATFGNVCANQPVGQTLSRDTAESLCRMAGYGSGMHLAKATAIAPPASEDNKNNAGSVQLLTNLSCPAGAWAFNNCSFDLLPPKATCISLLSLECGVPHRELAPFFFRFDPLRPNVLLARRRCTFEWRNVGADFRSSVTGAALCRLMGYASEGTTATIAPAPQSAELKYQLAIRASVLNRNNVDGGTPILNFLMCWSNTVALSSCLYVDSDAEAVGQQHHSTYNGDTQNHTNDLQLNCGGKRSVDNMIRTSAPGDAFITFQRDGCPPPLPLERVYIAQIVGIDAPIFGIAIACLSLIILIFLLHMCATAVYGSMAECLDHWLDDLTGGNWEFAANHPDVDLFAARELDTDDDNDADGHHHRGDDELAGVPPQVRAGLLLWKKDVIFPRERAAALLRKDVLLNVDAANEQQQLAILVQEAEARSAEDARLEQQEAERQLAERQRQQRRRERQQRREQLRQQQQQEQQNQEEGEGAAAADAAQMEGGEQIQLDGGAAAANATAIVPIEQPTEQGAAAAAAAAADATTTTTEGEDEHQSTQKEARKPAEADLIVSVPLAVAKWWSRNFASTLELRRAAADSEIDPRSEALKQALLPCLLPEATRIIFGYESNLGRLQLLVGVEVVVSSNDGSDSEAASGDAPASMWRRVVSMSSKRRRTTSTLVVPFAVAEDQQQAAKKSSSRIFFYTLRTFCNAAQVATMHFAPLFQPLCPAPSPRCSLATTPVERDGDDDDQANVIDADDDDGDQFRPQGTGSAPGAACGAEASSSPSRLIARSDHVNDDDDHHLRGLISWKFTCAMCFEDKIVELSLVSGRHSETIGHFPGCECSAARHFTCAGCLAVTMKDFIKKKFHRLEALPCHEGDCAAANGVITDGMSIVDVGTLRALQDAKIDAERTVGQRSIALGSFLA